MAENTTWLDLVREYFPNASDKEADTILYEYTGFPGFWAGDPVTCCRAQLQTLKNSLAWAQSEPAKGEDV